jgi:hypothetical protein
MLFKRLNRTSLRSLASKTDYVHEAHMQTITAGRRQDPRIGTRRALAVELRWQTKELDVMTERLFALRDSGFRSAPATMRRLAKRLAATADHILAAVPVAQR